MKLPWTPKPKTATTPELEKQLTQAKDAHQQALQAVGSAEQAFDDAGADADPRAVLSAREAAALAAEHVARAERLLGAAKAKAAQAERADKERACADLGEQLTRSAIIEAGAELAQREAELLITVAKLREQRADLADHYRSLERQHTSLLVELGQLDFDAGDHEPPRFAALAASDAPVAEMITAATRPLAPGRLRDLLIEIRPRDGMDLHPHLRHLVAV